MGTKLPPYKIYIAARYSRKREMNLIADVLSSYGIVVTSSWLDEQHSPQMTLGELSIQEHRKIAEVDIEDIIESDTMLFFAEDQNNQPPRGGRHCELGYALALGLKICVIGEPENIFHYLPSVRHYPSVEAFIEKELV